MDEGKDRTRPAPPLGHAAPLALHGESVLPAWIDYNGHMNLAYYVLAFDHATDAMFDYLDLGIAYRNRTRKSLFVLEAHVTYDRELAEGDPLRVTTQILDCDAKRIHYFHRMFHATEGFQAATNELIGMHIDFADRRSTPMPPEAQARVQAVMEAHAHLPRPAEAGRVIGIRRRSGTSP